MCQIEKSPQWDWGLVSRISHIACFYGHGGHGKEQLHIGLLLPACDSSFEFISFRVTILFFFFL